MSAQIAMEFERERPRLRGLAYRMLGSLSDAEDAVQEAWLRLERADRGEIENLPGWLTAVVTRVALDMLRTRRARREDYPGTWLPEPIVTSVEGDPEADVLLADSVGLALLVVLESLSPSERVAFVLHDTFAVPFSEVAEVLDTTPAAARQLASRARRRVRGAPAPAPVDAARQRALIDAFLAAAREGSFSALMEVLDPEVVFRFDGGERVAAERPVLAGAETVARQILTRGRPFAGYGRPAVVNGAPGVVVAPRGHPIAVAAFTFAGERIVAIDVIADPAKLALVQTSATRSQRA